MTIPTSSSRVEPAAMIEVAGHPVALHYGDPSAEYTALRRGALLVDRSSRHRMTFAGATAAETLTGLVTNDVHALAPGQGQFAAALTPKGKILADLRLFVRESDILVDVAPRAAEGWATMIRKFVNPRVVAYHDRSQALGNLGVFGPGSRAAIVRAVGRTTPAVDAEVLDRLPSYGHVTTRIDDADVTIVRSPDVEVEGFELFADAEVLHELWSRLLGAGAMPGGLEAFDIARIEAGRPEWGVDIDDSTIPQEANFDELHAISYTKGCYTGQETVARVHFRGHVNRHLRGLRFGDSVVPQKAQLVDASGKAVGDVRSVAMSPRLGGIALAMVRREVGCDSMLRATWADGEALVRVTPLPMRE